MERARAELRDNEHNIRRSESKNQDDEERIRGLEAQLERLKAMEAKYTASEIEVVKLQTAIEMGEQTRNRMEKEKEEVAKHWREVERKHSEEKVQLMAERASFAETARKAQADLEIRRELEQVHRSELSITGSGRNTERSSRSNSIPAVGATAVVGGVSFFAMKLLSKGCLLYTSDAADD